MTRATMPLPRTTDCRVMPGITVPLTLQVSADEVIE
jgi:hypothetical protein